MNRLQKTKNAYGITHHLQATIQNTFSVIFWLFHQTYLELSNTSQRKALSTEM